MRRAGRAAAAREILEHAAALEAGHAETHYALGLACQDLGDHEAAIPAYRAALAIRPAFHEAALNLGTALQARGDWESAFDVYALAVRLRPESIGRVAQALASASTGRLWLDPAALRQALADRG